MTWDSVRSWGARVSSRPLQPLQTRFSFGSVLTGIPWMSIFSFWPRDSNQSLLSFQSRETRRSLRSL